MTEVDIGFTFIENDKVFKMIPRINDGYSCSGCYFEFEECGHLPDCENGIYIEMPLQNNNNKDEGNMTERWILEKVTVPEDCNKNQAIVLFGSRMPSDHAMKKRQTIDLINPKLIEASSGLLGRKIMITIQDKETLEQIRARKQKRKDYQEVHTNIEPITDYEGYWKAMEAWDKEVEEAERESK